MTDSKLQQGKKMAPISPIVSIATMSKTASPLLKALLLRLKAEDPEAVLILTERDLAQAENYSLITTDVVEEKGVVFDIRHR